MKSLRLLILLLGAISVPAAWAEQTFPEVQYVSGKTGFEKKMKGTLFLTETELRFAAKEGNTGFTVSLAEIKDVSNSVENNPGSTGAKLALGVFASKKEEFVYVNTETKDAAEALIFKVKNKTSPAIVAKVKFQLKKLNEATAPAVTTETNATPKAEAANVPPAESKSDSTMTK
jgi:hypothetical protein